MSNIKKQELRLTAEKAKDNFMPNFMAPTRDLLALLDELEVSKKSNEFLKGQLAELANFNPDWDKLEASYESWREIAAELLVAKDRIAELREWNADLAEESCKYQRRIAEMDAGQKRIIGWRTADCTDETADPELAKNWAAAIGVLPIFEGDVNTKLSAAGIGKGE
ncbi:hypothetical protein RQL62_17860 [Citrobacter amalonaticus]|nr:hypothetical protein [Citrobacter amalonaticus]